MYVRYVCIPTSFQIVFVMRFKSSIDMGIYLEQTIKPWKVAAWIKTRMLSFDKTDYYSRERIDDIREQTSQLWYAWIFIIYKKNWLSRRAYNILKRGIVELLYDKNVEKKLFQNLNVFSLLFGFHTFFVLFSILNK